MPKDKRRAFELKPARDAGAPPPPPPAPVVPARPPREPVLLPRELRPRRPPPPTRPRPSDHPQPLLPPGASPGGSSGAPRRPPKSALSLDAFARAKRSTYDKRVVLAKRRDLQAARVNKYRKVQRRLGEEAMRPDDAFDPEKYAARLEAFERAEIVKDDGFGRGKRGRIPPPVVMTREEDKIEKGAASDEATLADKRGRGKRKRRGGPDDEPEGGSDSEPEGGSDSDDSDALFDNNVIEAAAPSSDEKERNDSGGDGDGDGDPLPGTSKRYSSGKGWNKTVKDQMRWEAEKKRRAEEMAELRAKWADEDAGRKRCRPSEGLDGEVQEEEREGAARDAAQGG